MSNMWILCSVLFLVLFGSSVSRTSDLDVTAEPGNDVTLRCGDTNINEVLVLMLTRSDLQEDKYVFFYRDNQVDLKYQHESFKNRVSLKNSQMKDGDLSVVLENVKTEDSGTYQCRVVNENDPQRELTLISSIRLMVIPPSGLITAEPGDDVTLRCEDTSITKVLVLNWTRTDLQKNRGYVSFRMKTPADPEGQPESFKNRVSLLDSQINDGNLSMVLKNVEIEDSGTYQCKVNYENGPSGDHLKLISTINLQVSPGNTEGIHWGYFGLIVVVVLICCCCSCWFFFRISNKKERPKSAPVIFMPTDDIQSTEKCIDETHKENTDQESEDLISFSGLDSDDRNDENI
ncbi:V-set and immunoglobulin domain-containing protein 1 [Oryzias melastigma]|uniref:V-set and immunoglobulin domain-containing protein 1-like n=1 Tax=Oryzias melastigma TaxID=30732 RepID=A0A3B3CUW5_ORYME|nr:V-set and immunoglobulin domain-containing protein 1 [Oryzias melastigma]